MQAYASSPYSFMDDIRQYSRFITASVVIHLICFLILVLAPYIQSDRHFAPSVINVDLVSIPSGDPPGNGLPRAKKSNYSKPKPVTKAPVVTKNIAVKKSKPSGKKIKKSLKKKDL
jgi:hypothetical protein